MSSMYGGGGFGNLRRGGDPGDVVPKGFKMGKVGQFDPMQQALYKRLFSDVGPDSFLAKLARGDEGTFQQMEAPGLRQFNALQGNMASRFSGMGMGARNSSGFGNAMNQAGSDFAQDMQGKRMELQRQALMDLFGMSESLLGKKPTDKFLVQNAPKKPSFFESLLPALGGIASKAIGGLF